MHFTVSQLTSYSGGRMCVGSHLAVYRKYNISLHADLASLILSGCIYCSGIAILWIGVCRDGDVPVFSVLFFVDWPGRCLEKANGHVYAAVISIG